MTVAFAHGYGGAIGDKKNVQKEPEETRMQNEKGCKILNVRNKICE